MKQTVYVVVLNGREIRITDLQLEAVRAVLSLKKAGVTATTARVGFNLGMDREWSRKYLYHRLVALRARGFLTQTYSQPVEWGRGPMADFLEEAGLLKTI